MYEEKSWRARWKVFMTFGFIPLFAFVVVMLIPFVVGIAMTFTNWNGLVDDIQWMGLDNYRDAVQDGVFWSSLWLTIKYVFFSIVLTNGIAFGLALLVTSRLKGRNVFRVGFFTPNLIGGVILGFIWQFIFARILVYIGMQFDIPVFATSWLADADKAFWALILVGVWQTSGYMMLIYIAGLSGIQESLLEAAQLDGASLWHQLIHIKIPLMVPAFTISIFLTLQRSFVVFDTNLSLTRGEPYKSTELIAMHVYNEAFLNQNFGVGQAKAFILFIIVAIIAVAQVRIMKKFEIES